MARPVPATFSEKIDRVQTAVALARSTDRRHFDFTTEVEPGVRLVLTEVAGTPLAFSLWILPQDIAEICSDASVPATAALLSIDGRQARAVTAAGSTVDLGQFTRSQSQPDQYYALFDHVSEKQIHTVLHRLVPALEPHPAAA
jgi:hypothetical protein